MSSKKIKGSESIMYNAVKGTIVTSGILLRDTWYKISSLGTSSNLPALGEGGIFKTPEESGDAITLATGDQVWPLTLTEICKADVELSGEVGVIDTTDSCDYPYNSALPDGFTNLSGTINTMLRFDEETEELTAVTQELLKRFFDIVEDDGEGTYTITSKDDSDLIFMILLNSLATTSGKINTWIITPAILNSISSNIPLKDVLKGDYAWAKGQGPASIYMREIPAES